MSVVDQNIDKIRDGYDYLISRGYLREFEFLPQFLELKEIIFNHMVEYLRSKEVQAAHPPTAHIYFITIMQRQLFLMNKVFHMDRTTYPKIMQAALREFNINQLI
jgi:hypothetical protein